MNIATSIARDIGSPFVGTTLVLYGMVYAVAVGLFSYLWKTMVRLCKLIIQTSLSATVSVIFIGLGVIFGIIGYDKLSFISVIAAIPFIALCGLADLIESMSERKSRKAGGA